MQDPDLNLILEVALDAAKTAGALVLDARAKGVEVSSKDYLEMVSSADVAADRAIISKIKSKFPNHEIISEETYPDPSTVKDFSGPFWVIDPIDGTVNFVYGQHYFAISIAYMNHGVVEASVVYAPTLNETYTAIKGGGAKLNGKKIQTTNTDNIKAAVVATGFPYNRAEIQRSVDTVHVVLKNCRDLRRAGAASLDLCSVACGRLDAYFETVKPWDIAAGLLIAREAGARSGHLISKSSILPDDIDGYERITASPGVFDRLCEILG